MSTASQQAATYDDPGHQAAALVNRAIISYEGMTAQWRRGLTINAHERLAIAHLWESGPMTMSELGERIPLSRAAVTSLTDRLERLGYVRRSGDPHDRRRTVLTLTELPQIRLTPIAQSWVQDLRDIRASFDDAEWATVTNFLDQLHERAHQQATSLRAISDEELLDRVGQPVANLGG
jgi:DNA-binding MarR family transcriptional regulator